MKSRHLTAGVTSAVLLILGAGCGDARDDGPTTAAPSRPVTASPPPGPPTATPTGAAPSPTTESPAASRSSSPSPASPSPASPSPSGPADAGAEDALRRGDTGDAVRALQQRLDRLGYWVGESDGRFGLLTEQAVYALQKAAGLRRDGVVGPKTRVALAAGKRPDARSTDGHLAEVDLDRQLLMIVDDGEVSRVFNASTGTFEHYTYQGETYLADTPRGRWTIDWQVDGWRDGPLGRLYRPKYFQEQGIAIHGYTSVPPYPASHGCVRVTLPAMDWLWAQDVLPKKTRVWVY
ncbi:L,D-transpeptidase family protein [Micromonospora sp. WMMD980]|uniref:L,D-transpeptidase family protein n=1 Tax=Micromonospora sp. WMMD980 TaxID=3016088 RepID=UPI00241704AB|nr:L,D-transpeptidase family protein [Micromonospora sp. WMMD980]MDG4801436.1 L,D-transpeptidase family protein [Micromonospora sp. WMMD980]